MRPSKMSASLMLATEPVKMLQQQQEANTYKIKV